MEKLSKILTSSDTYALLEDSKSATHDANNLLFSNPQEEIIAYHVDELPSALKKIEKYKKDGLYLCGYLSYEAGYYFVDKRIPDTNKTQQPLLYFIVFKELQRPSRADIDKAFKKKNTTPKSAPKLPLCIYDLTLNVSKKKYIEAISRIKKYIEAGDTYQINYTIKYNFKLQGDSPSLYKALRKTQPVEFGALLNFPESNIVSLSPELFIYKKDDVLTSKPMKGTAKRGKNEEEDQKIINFLKEDSKTLSENVMIVDLIRNDFGRICKIGSVKVKNLFQVQTFKSIHQMISTVKGKLKKGLSFTDILYALFPCGSITGAPKIRTMEIINELENEARGIYTGAIGYLLPNDDFYFNVPIRTIVVNDKNNKSKKATSCEMGIGSGIIYESDAHDEFAECLLKANFLRSINDSFYLIETFRFENNTLINLEEHLNRLSHSANYFGFELNIERVKQKLENLRKNLRKNSQNYKVRLTVEQNGKTKVSYDIIEKSDNPNIEKVYISDDQIDSTSVFQYHKTSRREHYNQAYDEAEKKGYYDVLFFNEKNQLAEASRHNVFIKKDGQYFTPPISAGILNGVQREAFLKKHRVVERSIYRKDLVEADEVLLTNSVRGVVIVVNDV